MSTQTQSVEKAGYQGTEKLLWGIVLAVLTFWLFAGSAGAVAPAISADVNSDQEWVTSATLNFAVSVTALFAGLFIVLFGGFADRFGRVKVTLIGVLLNIVGSLLLVFATGALATPLLIVGRAMQGLASACIMPASMALVKAYWDGKGRQRAVSMWSIGSWGGSGLSAVVGGALVEVINWRGIFIVSVVISVLAFIMIWGTPESKVETTEKKAFDYGGLVLFIVGTLSMMLVMLYGNQWGWLSLTTIALAVVAIVAYTIFYRIEIKHENPFIDFALFKNSTFTGATLSNFFVNMSIGMLFISQQVIQLAGCKVEVSDGVCPPEHMYSALDAGLLSLGYGIVIISFIRVGEKLLQKFGPRKPMLWGTMIVIVSNLMLMMTHLLIGQYVILAIVAYCLFGLGLAFYATPSTDAALANLPAEQAGSGAGIYKMASSLGSAIGTAITLAVFYGLLNSTTPTADTVVSDLFTGRTDNMQIRLAAMVALGVILVFLMATIISIVMTVPKQDGTIGPKGPAMPPEKGEEEPVERTDGDGTGQAPGSSLGADGHKN